jgi:hypothetical protein
MLLSLRIDGKGSYQHGNKNEFSKASDCYFFCKGIFKHDIDYFMFIRSSPDPN